jgi:hypothetical protein
MRPAPQARPPSGSWPPKSASRAAGGSGSKRRKHSTPGAAGGKPQAAPFRLTQRNARQSTTGTTAKDRKHHRDVPQLVQGRSPKPVYGSSSLPVPASPNGPGAWRLMHVNSTAGTSAAGKPTRRRHGERQCSYSRGAAAAKGWGRRKAFLYRAPCQLDLPSSSIVSPRPCSHRGPAGQRGTEGRARPTRYAGGAGPPMGPWRSW